MLVLLVVLNFIWFKMMIGKLLDYTTTGKRADEREGYKNKRDD